jgi:hypothetical protein
MSEILNYVSYFLTGIFLFILSIILIKKYLFYRAAKVFQRQLDREEKGQRPPKWQRFKMPGWSQPIYAANGREAGIKHNQRKQLLTRK